MSPFVRRAGRSTLPDGMRVVWSVADGRRGRRWRATTTKEGSVVLAILLEVGVDGRPSRLEIAGTSGMLTLHPEGTVALHGNVVTPAGVRHLAYPWSDAHELDIDGSPITAAVTARRLAGSVSMGEGRTLPVVSIAADVSVREGSRRYVRVGNATWRIEGDGEDGPRSLILDEAGVPAWPGESEEWPLELEDPADHRHRGQAVDKDVPDARVR